MRIEGEKARISFDYAETGLMAGEKTGLLPVREVPDGGLKGFAIAGEDQKWHWAKAVIEGGEVVVSSPDVLRPTAVRYAFTMSPRWMNLYSKAGLPASPFRTDDWPIGWGSY
jgi:sialate O-acetylesterase